MRIAWTRPGGYDSVMRVALVHDWLTGMRGGEVVLEELCSLLPQAPIFCLLWLPGTVSPAIERHRITTSFIQRCPGKRRHYRRYLPLFPMAIEGLDIRDFDRIISVSHCVAKGAIPAPHARHIAYMLSPVRYAWDRYHDYFATGSAGRFTRLLAPWVTHYLRQWDVASSARVDRFVADSNFVANRVQRYYRRDSEVLCPPVDCKRFAACQDEPEDFYLMVAALNPYKRVEVAMHACAAMGRKLVVVGSGPDRRRLARLARKLGGAIELRGFVENDELTSLYGRCRALLHPGVEDFGIAPLEAMAAGRPGVAFGYGGSVDTVVPLDNAGATAPTGVLYTDPTPGGLVAAMRKLESDLSCFAPTVLRTHAKRFDRSVFRRKLRELLASEQIDTTAALPC